MTKRINIVLPDDALRLLDKVASRGDRSRLISEAVRHYLTSRARGNLAARMKQGSMADAQPNIRRVPLDKREGVVKRKLLLGGAEAPLASSLVSQAEEQDTGDLAIDQFAVEPASFHQPSIRPKPSTMILLCEHPVAVAGAKVENGFIVFQGPQGRLLHRTCWMRERSFKVSV